MNKQGKGLPMSKPAPVTPRLLNPQQAAAYMAISDRKLWSLTKEGRLPAVKIDRAVRYDLADIDMFIKNAKGVA
jgi:excisionase family DNA binding protein